MSDTMSANGLQVLEPRPGMSGRASDPGSPVTYFKKNQDQVAWETVKIEPCTLKDGTDGWMLSADGFSGTSEVALTPFLHDVKFASEPNPVNEFVYASLTETVNIAGDIIPLLTLTYVQHMDVQNPQMREPMTQTGVWLGTSSGGGGQLFPKIKA